MQWWRALRLRLQRVADRLSVVVCDRHTANPILIGHGQHDCALLSLYWVMPSIPEPEIVEAFNLATDTWPYGGVTNKEFAIALKYLAVECDYSTDIDTLEALAAAKPARCVALLHGHFIPIIDGQVVGGDRSRHWSPETFIYCHWTLERPFVGRSRRTLEGLARWLASRH